VGVIVYAGILRIFSSGNPKKIQESNSYITGAIFGLLLLFGAAILFNTINPRISSMQLSGFKIKVPSSQEKSALQQLQETILKNCSQQMNTCITQAQNHSDLMYPNNPQQNCVAWYRFYCASGSNLRSDFLMSFLKMNGKFVQYQTGYSLKTKSNPNPKLPDNPSKATQCPPANAPTLINVDCP
ncbi:MAG: hypothetical protein ACP5IC_01290, partial [Minisyncoccia bacterium]